MSNINQIQRCLPRFYPISVTRFRCKHLCVCTVISHKMFLAGRHVIPAVLTGKGSTTKPENPEKNLTLKAKNCSKNQLAQRIKLINMCKKKLEEGQM